MFGGSRRRRPPTTPWNSATANPSAATAAASAFMSAANQNPNKALSSAAAAAALRARPHTPTNVAEVQTKRTVRRSASVSSSGSAAPAGARAVNGRIPLERRGSTASMTERTFRTPSPHRLSTPTARDQKPPVPQIPDGHRNSVTGSRGTGVNMQNFRTASQKMKSEPPSWHVQSTGDTGNVRTSDSIMTMPKPPPVGLPNAPTPQPTRPESRSSVNFSYPTAFRPQSPPASPTAPSVSPFVSPSVLHSKVVLSRSTPSASNPGEGISSVSHAQSGQQLVYDPNSRRMVPRAHVEEGIEQKTNKPGDKSPRKKRDSVLRREGGQLTKGTVVKARENTAAEQTNQSAPLKSKQPGSKILPITEETPEVGEPGAKVVMTAENTDANKTTQPLDPRKDVSRGQLIPVHQISNKHESDSQLSSSGRTVPQGVARVQDDRPKVEDRPQPPPTVLDALDAVPTRQALFEDPRLLEPSRELDGPGVVRDAHSPPAGEKSGLPESDTKQREAVAAENKVVAMLAGENGGPRRSNSNSPARQARFASGPTEKLAVRHVPLPRSASPIKSAMKQSSSVPRETSPSENVSDPSGSGAASPDQREDAASSRKKSVRVSFDDHGTVIVRDSPTSLEADSSAAQSPQGNKKTWFSNIGRSKKKGIILDDDEIMKPRPALPSFGSIRDKKTRELGERPLVRPIEPVHLPAISPSPDLRPQSSSTLNDSETTEDPSLGLSSDYTIGALLAQDQTSRNAANISRFREPLPPVVTSIEGYGYSSDSFQGSDYEGNPDGIMEAGISTVDSSALSTQPTQSDLDDSVQGTPTTIDSPRSQLEESHQTVTTQQKDIPHISVIQPSPMLSEDGPRANDLSTTNYFEVPGNFPDSESDLSRTSPLDITKNGATLGKTSPLSTAVFEPTATTVESGQVGALPQTTLDTTTPLSDLDITARDESDESIYSDAYEDIPQIDSTGFMSLDAIVESPTDKALKSNPPRQPESPPTTATSSRDKTSSIVGESATIPLQPSSSPDAHDWEQAKAFWRSLTTEKRRQLELEAAEEAGAEGDREEVSQPVRRTNSRRRSQAVELTHVTVTPSTQTETEQPESQLRILLRDERATKPARAQPQTSMRKTLRSNEGAHGGVRHSNRQRVKNKTTAPTAPIASQTQALKSRPQSSHLPLSEGKTITQPKPALERRGSDASDSSFKRSRRPTSGTYSFRQTMRQSTSAQSHRGSTKGSGRFSLRSLSPVGSTVSRDPNANFATSPGGMRRTLRSNSESSHEGKRSSVHFPLFTRSAKSSTKPSRWSSRFDDSSEDDDHALAGFRSRIDDSSDEEHRPASSRETGSPGKVALRSSATAPSLSRPAPVPELEEDSPELPDSDDDFMPSPLQTPQRRVANSHFVGSLGTGRSNSGAIGTSTLGRSRSGRGGFQPSLPSPAAPMKDGRGSFLSILRRNKRADQTGKIQRSELVDSAARRDTKLERDAGQLMDLRREQPSSPKLQKKTPVSRSDNGVLQRSTSAGNLFGRGAATDAIERPKIGDRRSLSLGYDPNNESFELENGSVASSGVPRKKKFRALRRMFKLDE